MAAKSLRADWESVILAETKEVVDRPILSLRGFVDQRYPKYQWYRHSIVLANVLQRVADDKLKRVMVFMPPRHGKPVYNKSMILLENGSLKAIEDIVIGDQVITHTGAARDVTDVILQGDLECYEVETVSGRKTIAAEDHPFLTTEGWVELKDLRVGMFLANVPNPKTTGVSELPVEAFRLAGYFLGDGCCTQVSPGITNADPGVIEDIRFCAEAVGMKAGKLKPKKHPTTKELSKAVHIPVQPANECRKFLSLFEMQGKKSAQKRVPEIVYKAGREQVAAFLGAYFACDGSINKKGGAREDSCVEFYSISEELLKGIQHLLLRLGIQSNLKLKNGRYQNQVHQSYRLSISSMSDVWKFKQVVPVAGEKHSRLLEWQVSPSSFNQSLFPDRIKSITPAGLKPCRCLTVDVDHSYTVDDLVVHNSLLTSKLFPAYLLYRYPDRWVGINSYAAELAYTFSRASRDAFRESGGEFRGDANTVRNWETPQGGGCWAAGVGGPITGKGFGSCGVVDDPLKNAEDAMSDRIRSKQKDWWGSTFYTRAEPDAAIVLVQTRWHDDDLAGWLLKEEANGEEPECWHVVNFEAVKEDESLKLPPTCTIEPDWRKPGEALCPERFGIERLRKIKPKVGAYFWNALYQQRPAPLEGGFFKRSWWQFYKQLPGGFDRIIQSWDCAFKETSDSDYVVGQVWGQTGSQFYLIDQIRERLDINGTLSAIRTLTARYPEARAKLVEDKANGPAVIDLLSREISGLIAINPEGGKQVRAVAIAPFVEAGNVFLPDPTIAPWIHDWIIEFSQFPNGAHDDQVDSATQAVNWLASNQEQYWGTSEVSWGY